MTSNSSTIPLHEPVGKDTNNWTTLSNKEAKIRAKLSAQKGHEPHDWRWAFNKVFKTNKAYPESLRPAVAASNVPSGNENTTHAPGASHVNHTTDVPPVSNQFDNRQDGRNQFDHRQDGVNQFERHQEGGHVNTDHTSTAPRSHNVVDAPLGSNLLGHQQREGPITAPENAPEMAGGRDRASEPKIQTNIVA